MRFEPFLAYAALLDIVYGPLMINNYSWGLYRLHFRWTCPQKLRLFGGQKEVQLNIWKMFIMFGLLNVSKGYYQGGACAVQGICGFKDHQRALPRGCLLCRVYGSVPGSPQEMVHTAVASIVLGWGDPQHIWKGFTWTMLQFMFEIKSNEIIFLVCTGYNRCKTVHRNAYLQALPQQCSVQIPGVIFFWLALKQRYCQTSSRKNWRSGISTPCARCSYLPVLHQLTCAVGALVICEVSP